MTPNRTSNNEQIMINPFEQEKQVRYYKQVIPVSIHHFYITGEIKEPDYYMDMINVLKTADQHDTIFLYLNTPGGYLHTTIQIIAAMKQSSANVVTCLEGEVCSAGTLIFLAGDRHIVNPHSSFMIHSYSHVIGGKGPEVSSRVKHSEILYEKISKSFYSGFLTDQEIAGMLDGKDIWMDSDEVIRRLGVTEEENKITSVLSEAIYIDPIGSSTEEDAAE